MNTVDPLMTPVKIPEHPNKIHYQDPILLAGSCFAEHISAKLARYKYDVLANPFGILYNPVSLATSFNRIAKQQEYYPDELVLQDGLFHSMDHHGSFSGTNKEKVLHRINSSIHDAHEHLQKSSFVFISPGTTVCYRYKPTGTIAGNCHKIPQTSFDSYRLSLPECIDAFEQITSSIMKLSPMADIIWTVSPVRHVRDGLVENQRSKSVLLLAIEEILKKYPGSAYFPAYEIMLDQLRDYRYYARDLIHPSDLAVDIIWGLFCDSYVDRQDRDYHAPIEKIKRAIDHRVLHDDREAITAFAQNQLKQIDHLAALLPDLNWQAERQYFFQYLEMD
jgi:hypothetical protein